MYSLFSLLYLIGWILTIYVALKKINSFKEFYTKITDQKPILQNVDKKNFIPNIIKHIILQIRISNFRTKLMHSSLFIFAVSFIISPIFLFFPILIQWILDSILILGLVGIILAILRRYVLKVPRIIISSTKDRYLIYHILLFINILTLTFFSYFSFNSTTPLLFAIDNYFRIPKSIHLQLFFGVTWISLLYVLLSRIDKGKLFHILLGPVNIIKTEEKDFTIKTIDSAKFDSENSLGVENIKQIGFKDFIEIFSCTECGRCQEACPAFTSNQPLSPKSILVKLLDNIDEFKINGTTKKIIDNYKRPESIGSCTTCGACYNSSPVLINPLKKIIDLRRNLVMEQGELPPQLQETLNSIEIRNHPFKGTTSNRLDWTKHTKNVKIIENANEDVDYIYWVGCATSFNEQAQKIAIKLSNILNQANINIGILKNENCTGDPARRIGNEYLFQILAEKNIELLKKYNKKIITSCPHCYNSIKNEYPQIDTNFKPQIYHHSQILSELIKKGIIKTKKQKDNITFHDPCYLGRQNGIIQEPRDTLKGYDIKEMENNKSNSFCCGAGGGMYWLEQKEYPKINHKRLEQAIKVSNNIATACPFCLLMLQDAVNTKGLKNQVYIRDITEWIETE
ncbi:MAG: heterodisulfide reductase-related iron-sulfur binding cluster [bacterium]|nr:heterodisulfide reductase-related iron-sulfur binding cluster [bacterium]